MRIPYIPENPQRYLHYYRLQRGGDLPYYRGSVYQRGDGLGSLFSSVARFVTRLPGWVKTGASMLGRQAARTGMQVAQDMAANTDQWKQDWRTATKQHLKRAAGELLEEGGRRIQQQGKGIKGGVKRRRTVTKRRSTTRKTPLLRRRQRQRRQVQKPNRRATLAEARTKRDIFAAAPAFIHQ